MLLQLSIKKASHFSCCCLIVLLCHKAAANTIDIDTSYYSTTLKRVANYSVAAPSDYYSRIASGHRYPVLYLLHCAGCDHRSFIESYFIAKVVDSVNMIVVMPDDGTSGGWWLDSPIDTLSKLSTWLAGEFKNHIDHLYPTLTNRAHTGIAGHSMGGFGALHNLAQHSDIFGAAFSAKGLLAMVGHRGAYMAQNKLGSFELHTQNYYTVDIFENIAKFKDCNAAIKFYSGPNDWFQAENRLFDTLLTEHAVPHTYFENSEQHYPMSQASMYGMLSWFDSLFTQNSASTQLLPPSTLPNPVPRLQLLYNYGKSSSVKTAEKLYNLNGTMVNASSINNLPQGVVIGVSKK